MNNTEMKAFWTDYWASGVKTSFMNDFSENYEGAFFDHWSSYFVSGENNSKVLDIGCGNGGLTELWFLYCKGRSLSSEIIGVDLADLNVVDVEHGDTKMRCVGGIDFTKLPFEDETFDMVISMFGFEYGDRHASLQSVQRVLKAKSGVFRFVSHFDGSMIVNKNKKLLILHRDILNRCELFSLLKALCIEIDAFGNQPLALTMREKTVSALLSEFRTALQPLYIQYGSEVESTSFFDLFRYLLGDGLNMKLDKKLELIDSFDTELVKDSGRLDSLLSAAFSGDEISGLKTLFQTNQLYLEEPEVLQDANGNPLAIVLTGHKI